MAYEMIEFIDINGKSFKELTPKEAKIFFKWFMDTNEERHFALQNYIDETSAKKVVLDYSVESLVDLWEWWGPHIEYRELTKEEMKIKLDSVPERLRPAIAESNKRLTELTLMIIWDIGRYYGDVLVKNNPELKWDIVKRPKSDHAYNRPSIWGFAHNIHLYPMRVVNVMTGINYKKNDINLLIDHYKYSVEEIEK